MPALSVGVVMPPLAVEALDIEAGIYGHLMHGEGHMRVYVPVLHSMDYVYRALVNVQCPRQEVPLLPVVGSGPCQVVTSHVRSWSCVVSLQVSLTGILDVAAVPI